VNERRPVSGPRLAKTTRRVRLPVHKARDDGAETVIAWRPRTAPPHHRNKIIATRKFNPFNHLSILPLSRDHRQNRSLVAPDTGSWPGG
jgi:hypothetical protein